MPSTKSAAPEKTKSARWSAERRASRRDAKAPRNRLPAYVMARKGVRKGDVPGLDSSSTTFYPVGCVASKSQIGRLTGERGSPNARVARKRRKNPWSDTVKVALISSLAAIVVALIQKLL